jgi:hypothetical protein
MGVGVVFNDEADNEARAELKLKLIRMNRRGP